MRSNPKSRRQNRIKSYQNLKPFKQKPQLESIDLQISDGIAEKLEINHLADLKELIVSFAEKPHIAKRLISTFAYCILQFNKIQYKKTKEILESIGCCDINTASKWANILRNSDNPLVLLEEHRKYTADDFYHIYPEIKAEAICYAEKRIKDKVANFKSKELSQFINSTFTKLTGETIEDGVFVRSESSCRRDLIKWGAKFECNKKRPYFEGHERSDVIDYRNKFIELFDISTNDFGYLQKKDNNQRSFLEKSIVRVEDKDRCILICHDESTFRMGESPSKKWVWNQEYGFFNKG